MFGFTEHFGVLQRSKLLYFKEEINMPAGSIYWIEKGLMGTELINTKHMLRFSDAAAHFITTCKGSIRATPEYAEIQRKLKCKSGKL